MMACSRCLSHTLRLPGYAFPSQGQVLILNDIYKTVSAVANGPSGTELTIASRLI